MRVVGKDKQRQTSGENGYATFDYEEPSEVNGLYHDSQRIWLTAKHVTQQAHPYRLEYRQ